MHILLRARTSEKAVAVSRAMGGIALGLGLVTFQPYVLHHSLLACFTPLERTSFGAIARLYATIFTQPYILIPTIIISGILAWAVERLCRNPTLENQRRTMGSRKSPNTSDGNGE